MRRSAERRPHFSVSKTRRTQAIIRKRGGGRALIPFLSNHLHNTGGVRVWDIPMRRTYLIAITLLCIGCGVHSSSSSSSKIQGTWIGDKIYGGASCSDGTFIGAGTGRAVGKLTLIVEGGDEIGSEVTTTEDACVMHGTRTTTGFTVEAISGCAPEIKGITFTLTGDNAAGISYRGDITKIAPRSNTAACLANITVAANR